MSMTLNITCDSCEKTLWVGQHSSRNGWYLYTADESTVSALNKFVNDHYEHLVRFEYSDCVNLGFDDITDYGSK